MVLSCGISKCPVFNTVVLRRKVTQSVKIAVAAKVSSVAEH